MICNEWIKELHRNNNNGELPNDHADASVIDHADASVIDYADASVIDHADASVIIQRLYKEQQPSLQHQCPRWHTQACLAPMCLKNGSGNALAGRLWEFFLGRILKTLPHPKCTAHLVCSRDSSCEWVDFVSARMLAYLSRNVRPSRYQNGTHQTPSRIHSTTDVPVLLARKGVWHIHS